MTELKKLGLVLVTCSGIMGFSYVINEFQKPLEVEMRPLKLPKIEIINPNHEPMYIEIDQTDAFLDAIGNFESGNRYHITNRWGYMGKYQFHRRTLKELGYNVSKKKFLNSPELQERAMMDLLESNKRAFGSRIKRWENRKVNGKYITESGILAAAHLGGVGNVINFMENGEDFKDGNGTSIVKYLTIFSGYNINVD